MESAWFSIAVTIGIFVLVHIIASVWWASRVSTMLEFLQANLTLMAVEIKSMKDTYVRKEDLASLQKSHDAMWQKIDSMQKTIGLIK